MGLAKKRYAEFSEGRTTVEADQHAELLKGPRYPSNHRVLLNHGQDDQMVVLGYRPSPLRTAVTYVMIVLTGGLLRLVFHWVPRWFLRATSVPCAVTDARRLLVVEMYNGKHRTHHVEPLRVLTPECVRKLNNNDDGGDVRSTDVAPSLSVHFSDGVFRELDRLLLFDCKKVTYVWDPERQEFAKLRGLDQGVSAETLHKSEGLSCAEQFMRRLVYGPNKILVEESSVLTLLFLEGLNPFYIFQLMSFVLWFVDNYYYYALTILLMSLFGIIMTVRQTRKNQRNLNATVHSSDVCTVLRRSPKHLRGESTPPRTEIVSTDLLVPGDVLEIPSHGCTMHCDALLLTGNCILNESMLTGESVPVTKTPLPNLPDVYYDPKEHARHTLFCGTEVIQTRYFGDEKVLAVVIRTGFSTAKGGLVRSILHPPPVDFRFEKDSYRFVALLAGVAGLGFVYTVITKVMRGVTASHLVLEALDLITIVVPPALPAAMSVGRFYAQKRLQKNKIFCISPRSINVAGSIDCVCFDKTGTLTEDGLDLLCVVPITFATFQSPVRRIETLPYNTLLCGLVSCHSITIIDNQPMGDPLDLKMFESTKWTIEDQDFADNTKFNMIFPTVFKPPKNRHAESQCDVDLEIGVIREFPFSSSAQRMGVIIRKLGGQHFEYYCKGSPEMLLNFVRRDSVPDDFHDVLESYTQEGYRVIAIAHRELRMSYTKVHKVQREDVEVDLTLLGLIVLENRLKPETTPCIQDLNDAKIRVIMVTGDNILTALSVAKDCGIITPHHAVITVNADSSNPPQLYFTLTSTKGKVTDLSLLTDSASVVSLETVESQTITDTDGKEIVRPTTLFNTYRFAITGKVWSVVREYHSELIPRLVTRGGIYARMSPDQKQQLVQELQALGYCVAMCGDGANDCGALKAAHTGISLSEAESSVASPFTSKNPNIECVLKVIKEGRAALVTSFGIFKYMAAYSLCQFVSVMILYSMESNLTDIQFLYIDLFIISIFAFFFGKTQSYPGKLVKETPLSSLISFSPIFSLALQTVLLIVFQVAALAHLKSQPWYKPFDIEQKEEKNDVGCVENYTIFTVSSFQYIILAIAFSRGKPYRASIFSNYGLIVSAFAVSVFSIYLAVYPADFFEQQFELVLPENFNFRFYLLGFAVANFLASVLIEVFVIEDLVFKRLRFRFHDVERSKRKFLAIERDLNGDTKWPPLTSEFRSAASPLTSVPTCTAEIVVEKENRFSKDHVLNSLLEEESSPSRSYRTDTLSDSSVYGSPEGSPLRVFEGCAKASPADRVCSLEMNSFKGQTAIEGS